MKIIALAGSNSKNPINKHMLLMANSLGARGGIDLLTAAKNRFLFIGADVIGTCTLSEFYNNFNAEFGSILMGKAQ
jgi:NAD(P)H-dependent FMN reductase